MSVIQLPSQSQMRNQNENHKTASPQLRFLQETLSNSFIFLISCIILDSILRLLLAGNDSKGRKKISSVFKLLCSSFDVCSREKVWSKGIPSKRACYINQGKKAQVYQWSPWCPSPQSAAVLWECLCASSVFAAAYSVCLTSWCSC